ncbi:MAG: iron-sulfur cluster assembly scaffold protein [Candidatus Latescibacteria bacterium]|nr:iron-sulfur cluster assembly scaffold protein [Candidatus Latescibacterota bacterium]
MYTPQVMDHFQNPRNVGDIPDADAVGLAGNPVCGDTMKLSLKIVDDRIVDAKFRTFGCAAAIATSSKLTEMLIGQTIAEALTITNESVAGALGGLPQAKMHCSVLAADGVRAAVADYRKRDHR